MLDLNTLQLVQALAQSGSFTAAADRLGCSKTTISLQIKALEQHLGVALFRRTTRQVSLTRSGEQLLSQCLPLYQQLQDELRQLQHADSALSGRLVMTAPEDFISSVMAPVLVRFGRQHPDLTIELRSSDAIRDLVKEGIDVAFRGGWLRDSSLTAQRLGSFGQWLVASPALVQQRGLPNVPADLQDWPLVAFSQLRQPQQWTFSQYAASESTTSPFAGQSSRPPIAQQQLHFHSPFLVASTGSVRTLVLAGAGLGVMTSYAAAPLIARGELLHLLPHWQLPEGGTFAVYPPGRQRPLKVQHFVAALQQHMQQQHHLPAGPLAETIVDS